MSKGQEKKINNEHLQPDANNIVFNIDYDELAKAIVKARNIEKVEEEKYRKEKKAEYRKKIGFKEDGNKIALFFNHFWCSLKLLICPKKYIDISELRANYAIMSTFLTILYFIIESILIIISLAGLIALILPSFAVAIKFEVITGIPYTVLALLFSRIFHIARIELDNLNNKEQLYAVFSAMVSFVALVVAIMALITQGARS